jgi:MFS family permease
VGPLLALVSAIVLVDVMFYSAITPLLPSYADDLDLSKSQAGVLSGAYAAGTMAASIPAGFLAMRWGVRPTLLSGLGLLAISCVAFGFARASSCSPPRASCRASAARAPGRPGWRG